MPEPKTDIWSRWVTFLGRHLIISWVVIGIVTAVGVHFTRKLRLNTDLQRLLPKTYTSVKTLNEITDRMGGNGDFRFIIESNNWDKTLQFGKEFAAKLREMPDMKYVDFERPKDFYEKNQLLYLSTEELDNLYVKLKKKVKKAKMDTVVLDLRTDVEKAQADGGYHNAEFDELEQKYLEFKPKEYHYDKDKKYLLIRTMPAASQVKISEAKRIYDLVDKLWRQIREDGKFGNDVTVTMSGAFRSRILEYDTVVRDVVSGAWIIVSLTLLLIYICFRSVTWTFICTAPLVISMMWTFGVVYLTLDALNLITAFMFMIMLGLGIDYGIALVSRYVADRRSGMNCNEALTVMLRHTGKGSRTAATTMTLSFFSLLITDFKGFSEFGVIMGIGIPFALISYFTVMPAMLIIVDRYMPFLSVFPKVSEDQPIKFANYAKFPFARPLFTASLILGVVGLWSLFNLEFEYDFSKLRAKNPDGDIVRAKIESIMGKRSNSPAIFPTETAAQSQAVKDALKKLMESRENHSIDIARSILDVVPSDQEEKIETITNIDNLLTENMINDTKNPDDQRRLRELKPSLKVRKPISMSDIPEELIRSFRDANKQLTYFTLVYPKIEMVDARNAMKFQEDVGEVVTTEGTFHASSQSIIFADMMRVMTRDGTMAFFATTFLVFLCLLRDFRNLKTAVVIMTPLMLSMLAHTFIMKVMGIHFNIYNIVAFPALIGEGMEYSIQLTNRYLEEPHRGPMYAVRTMFKPLFYCAATSLVGYGGLVMADHPGLRSLGISSGLGILLALLFAIILTPAIWQLFPAKKNAHHKDDSQNSNSGTSNKSDSHRARKDAQSGTDATKQSCVNFRTTPADSKIS